MVCKLAADSPNGDICFGPDGALYISEGTNDRILRMTPIPEPSTLALLFMGTIGLLGHAWRRRRRHESESARETL